MRRIALVVFVAFACSPLPTQAHDLRFGYHPGDTYKYAIHETTDSITTLDGVEGPFKTELAASETITVKSVDPNGTADLWIELTNVVRKSDPAMVRIDNAGEPNQTLSMKVGADGRILEVNNSPLGDNPSTLSAGSGFASAILPDTAVKIGDTWSKDSDQALGAGIMHSVTKGKYARDESVRGFNAAVVQSTTASSFAIPGTTISSRGTMTSNTTTWVDPKGHRLLKSHQIATFNSWMPEPVFPGVTRVSVKGRVTIDLTPA